MTELNTMDRIAMYLGGGLLVLALPVMGTIVILAGSMSPLYTYSQGDSTGYALAPGMAPEGAQIVSSPIFDPILRGYIVLIGLVIFMLLAVYKLFSPAPGSGTTTR
ncbi:MAG: hypothetical protein ABEJ67_04595 [Halanaeroarchaeum sp.]